MNTEKLRYICTLTLTVLGISLGAYIFIRYIFVTVLPFLVAWLIAFALRPPAKFLSRRLHIPLGVARLFLTLLTLLGGTALVSVGIWLISKEIWGLIYGMGEGTLESFLSGIVGTGGILERIFGDFSGYVAEGISKLAISLLTTVGAWLTAFAGAVPRALLFLLITVIATVYFSLELETINRVIRRLLPEGLYAFSVRLKDGFLSAFVRYARSYLLLLVITFFEMLAGLFIIRASYPLLLATVIAVLDLLPVIGVGTVLIPWSVLSFVRGDGALGASLIVLFIVHTVLRQILEPKIVGKNLGVHPVLTLVFLYVGYSLFGFVGLILVPILTVITNFALGKDDAAEIEEGKG